MKNLIAFLSAVALFTVAVQAQSPVYNAQTLNIAAYLPVTAAKASNTTAVIDCRKQSKVAVAVFAQCDTGGGAITLRFVPSLDNSKYGGNALAGSSFNSISFTPTTAGVTCVTNLDTFGAGYLKLAYITNDTGANLTNMTIKYATKISAP